MLGNTVLESNQYYPKFLYQLRSRMQYWASQGAITPQELQIMCAMAQNPGQQTIGFLQSLGVRYPNGIDEQHMQSEIDESFLPAMRQAARQRIAMGAMGPVNMNSMGMNGVGGFMNSRVEPMSAFSTGRSMAAGLFGEMKIQPTVDAKKAEPPKEQPTAKLPDPVKPWKCPEFDNDFQTSKFTICNCANVVFGKFNLHDGKSCLRMLINDPRVRYTSDQDVLGTYRPYLNTFRNDHKFVTIQYKQLMFVPVGREEMLRLANDIALTISKIDTGLNDRLKTIVQITRGSRYSFACSEAYNKLFCDEFDLHMQCGELTTSKEPKRLVLNRFNTIQDILSFVTKDVSDKSAVRALEAIPDYYKTLNQIVENIIYDIALNFTKKIINPTKHLNVLGSYMRTLPPVWSTDTDLTMHGTEDLMELWVMSNVQISGSKSDGAIAADSALKSKIDELDKQFTVFWLWRTMTWTDYPASSAVAYNDKGECMPSVWDLNNPKSDVAFYIGELMKATEEGSDAQMKRSPHSIYMDFEESLYSLNYGWTVDAKLWLGCSRYWK